MHRTDAFDLSLHQPHRHRIAKHLDQWVYSLIFKCSDPLLRIATIIILLALLSVFLPLLLPN